MTDVYQLAVDTFNAWSDVKPYPASLNHCFKSPSEPYERFLGEFNPNIPIEEAAVKWGVDKWEDLNEKRDWHKGFGDAQKQYFLKNGIKPEKPKVPVQATLL